MKKLSIVAVDDMSIAVEAQYNPKEYGIDKSVSWNKVPSAKADAKVLQFGGSENRTLSFELFFDTSESGSNVYEKVAKLEAMTVIPKNADAAKKHPPMVKVVWGGNGPLKNFVCVIEKLSTKYTMFLPSGTPVRATCSISVKQLEEVQRTDGSKG